MRMGGVSCLRRRSADGDHTHALVAEQSRSFPDNLVALLGHGRAWNYSAETAALLATFCCSTARQNAVPWDAVWGGSGPKEPHLVSRVSAVRSNADQG